MISISIKHPIRNHLKGFRCLRAHRGESRTLVHCEATSYFFFVRCGLSVEPFLFRLVTDWEMEIVSYGKNTTKGCVETEMGNVPSHWQHLLFLVLIVIHLSVFSQCLIKCLMGTKQREREVWMMLVTEIWMRRVGWGCCTSCFCKIRMKWGKKRREVRGDLLMNRWLELEERSVLWKQGSPPSQLGVILCAACRGSHDQL